jgi:hydrogenase expression/formation protein HypE
LYVANEGRFVSFVPEGQADHALAVMRDHAVATEAVRVGEVAGRESSIVILKTVLGTHRILDLLSGEQLPRIC